MKVVRMALFCFVGPMLGGYLFGCALFDQHAKDMDVMRGMAAAVTDRLSEGSMAQMQVSGQALNPGIVVEAAIVYRASACYSGLAGQFSTSSQGTLGAATGTVLDSNMNPLTNATVEERRKFREWLIGVVDRATSRPVR